MLTNDDKTRDVIELPTKSCTQKLEEKGSCQQIENTSSTLYLKNRTFPPLHHSRPMKRPIQHVAPMSKANPSEPGIYVNYITTELIMNFCYTT